MRPAWLLVPLIAFIGCSGSSSSKGKGSDSGSGGRETAGAGGRTGTGGSVSTSGAAGTGVGMTGGTDGGGGSGGNAGEGEAGEAGIGTTAGRGGSGGTGAIGGTDATGGTNATGGTGASGARPPITSCAAEFPFAGTWEGSVLDFYFEPIQAVHLVITPNDEFDGYEGLLTWGSGSPPPPVTSGDEPFPNLEFWQSGDGFDGSIEPWPGFRHTVVRGAGCDGVLRVSVSVAEPWDEWCSLQTPVYTEGYDWGCTYVGPGSMNSTTCSVQDKNGQVVATYPPWRCVACGTFEFGKGVCGCTEAGCSYNREPTDTFSFELGTSGGVDVLTAPYPRCDDCTMRLERLE